MRDRGRNVCGRDWQVVRYASAASARRASAVMHPTQMTGLAITRSRLRCTRPIACTAAARPQPTFGLGYREGACGRVGWGMDRRLRGGAR